jgi:hypothetical protein
MHNPLLSFIVRITKITEYLFKRKPDKKSIRNSTPARTSSIEKPDVILQVPHVELLKKGEAGKEPGSGEPHEQGRAA